MTIRDLEDGGSCTCGIALARVRTTMSMGLSRGCRGLTGFCEEIAEVVGGKEFSELRIGSVMSASGLGVAGTRPGELEGRGVGKLGVSGTFGVLLRPARTLLRPAVGRFCVVALFAIGLKTSSFSLSSFAVHTAVVSSFGLGNCGGS